jgi:hypothetical protein
MEEQEGSKLEMLLKSLNRSVSNFTPLDIYTFGHLQCPKAKRIAPVKAKGV